MGEYRSMLERVGARAKPKDDAFDRLERRRQRRQRNRRIATAVFAFVIAISGSFAAFEAFRGSNGGAAIGGTGPFYALWPERTLPGAEQAQATVDGGADAWRLDARTSAGRFVALEFGWSGFGVTVPDGANLDGPGPVTLDAATSPMPCPTPGCPPGTGPRHANVVLQRLVRPDATGIWSVVEVYDASPVSHETPLRLPLELGATVISGQEISFPFTVPDGMELQGGYTYIGDCSLVYSVSRVRVADGTASFRVADSSFDESCGQGHASAGGSSGKADLNRTIDGYVFVLLVKAGTLPYDPVTGGETDGEPSRPSDETPIGVAAVSVHFVPASEAPSAAAAPDVAEVACDGKTTQVLTPEVAAQSDGVHIHVTNTSPQDLSLEFRDFGGDNAPVGNSEVVWPFPPGTVELRCMDPYLDNGVPAGYVTLGVVDQNGIYHPLALECVGGAVGGFPSYAEGARGWEGDPVDIVREHGIGLLPSDDVSYAGYPKQQQPQVRVVREGAVVGVFEFFDDGHGGWLMSSYQACGDAGVGLAARR